jgi:hypothetical protein
MPSASWLLLNKSRWRMAMAIAVTSFRNDLTDFDLVDLVAVNEELQASVGQEIV